MENRGAVLLVGIGIGFVLSVFIPVWLASVVALVAFAVWAVFVRGRTTT